MKVDASKQRGITLIGFIIVLVVAGFFAYMGMILGPAYSEYYSVVKAINTVAADATPNTTDMTQIRRALDRQFNVGYVDSVTGSDAKLIRDKTTGNMVSMVYEVRKPFIYNIDFVVKFAHTAPLGSKTAGD
jgi:Tfp pilus assembly major pilin PilA